MINMHTKEWYEGLDIVRDPDDTDEEHAEWVAEIVHDRKIWNQPEVKEALGRLAVAVAKRHESGKENNVKEKLSTLAQEAVEMRKASEYIGNQVKAIREQNRLSQAEFANRINTTSQIVSAMELSHICRIDEVFDAYDDLNDFIEEFLGWVCKEFKVARSWFDIKEAVHG
jgi:DNA-binding transcriptional regulator YiaG